MTLQELYPRLTEEIDMAQLDYATLPEEDLSADERLLQLFRDAEKKREARNITRLWLVVFTAGLGLLAVKLCGLR
jgi:hypothetical protein